ncbi:MAG: ATP-binding cassette domain-containing protein [Rivihabitans pingtungensis]
MDDDALRAWSVSVRYPGQPEPALADVSWSIGPQALTVALGPSGCANHLAECAGRFCAVSQGRVMLAGAPITGPGADRAVVFQHDALLPWLDVRDNVAFALELQGVGRRERHARAEALLAEVGLAHAARQPVWTLSGGMRQRVGIACAGQASRALLMDERLARWTLSPASRCKPCCWKSGGTAAGGFS